MIKIGYWNINKKSQEKIGELVIDLIVEYDLDVLFLSEFKNLNKDNLIDSISSKYKIAKTIGVCDKVLAIVKRSTNFDAVIEGKRHVVLQSSSFNLAIAGLHLSDRRNFPEPLTRIRELDAILESIKHAEYRNHIFVGDFNCSPFDIEVICSSGMHSVLFKKEMNDEDKKNGKHYNPMLFVLNENEEVYGSYRYINKEYPLYWYSFDQVIVSKSLMERICDIKYLKKIKRKTLMSKKDSKPLVSDHLPLIFKIGD